MPGSEPSSSLVVRYLGPVIPLGLAAFGLWVLFSGTYTFRATRGSTEMETLLRPDSTFAAVFFISLALLIAAFAAKGRLERWLFWGGLAGTILAIGVVGTRQLMGLAVYA